MKDKYVIGMVRKCDNHLFLCTSSGAYATKRYDEYNKAEDEIKRMTRECSTDYTYIIMSIIASASIAERPVEIFRH